MFKEFPPVGVETSPAEKMRKYYTVGLVWVDYALRTKQGHINVELPDSIRRISEQIRADKLSFNDLTPEILGIDSQALNDGNLPELPGPVDLVNQWYKLMQAKGFATQK